MLDLKDTTFIVPIRIESTDRAFNFQYVIQYLCRNFETNIMVWESDKKPIASEILRRINPYKTKIKYWFEKTEDSTFHRTRLLNEMLADCKTTIVVNYDADILLEPSTYLKACEAIRSGQAHLVYPYFLGESQKKVFRTTLRSNLLEEQKHHPARSLCGHCQFFDRKAYIEGGMENESFLSYGAEDVERMDRFRKLGYKVIWLDDCYVYHIEHSRGPNSGKDNPHFEANENLFNDLSALDPDQLRAHYKTVSYLKKYMPHPIWFLTYSDENYAQSQKKLEARAKELNTADLFIHWNRHALMQTEFYTQNKTLLDEKIGAGYWAWKPYLILEALQASMAENDLLVYIDSGDWISSSFREFIIRKMRTHNILLTEGGHPNSAYTKRDCFVSMGCDEKRYWDAMQVEAGIFVCRKNDVTIHLVKEWLNWCIQPAVVMDAPNIMENALDFVQHRRDQSILSIMKELHKIECTQEMRQFINCNQQEG